jgi:hypothetical protein
MLRVHHVGRVHSRKRPRSPLQEVNQRVEYVVPRDQPRLAISVSRGGDGAQGGAKGGDCSPSHGVAHKPCVGDPFIPHQPGVALLQGDPHQQRIPP